ncbi:prostaglandin E receptor 2b subtype EP2 [Seriola aureovittata]|uniref:prostaglandin E receptor 2b subtype EP2 n=1 Tax=Seriola aureovittata TaxID=2871759 RepID=UPI0024BD8380|nr:prostaglandin E receptor 2b subtype EP2 [Seriola aureovittata]
MRGGAKPELCGYSVCASRPPPIFTGLVPAPVLFMSTENNSTDHYRCHDIVDVESGQPITSAVMFSAGVVGNIMALVLLEVRRRRTSPSLHHVLVTALLMTDLLGSVSVSPVVLSAYAQGKTLVGMSANAEVCSYFGFNMTFLSLSTLAILCVMALERYLSIGHPYFYERHLSKRCGYITIALIYLACVIFCIAPFLGFGEYVQYCPGTWCFLDMSHAEVKGQVYIGFYASFILIVTSTTVVCNIAVLLLLVMMYRRRVSAHSASRSMTEEVEHLLPLATITVVFICCTLPLVLRVYVNLTGSHEERHAADLRALRLLSFHSILNPWVFIILRPSLLKILWRKLHKPQESTLMRGKTLNARSKQRGGGGGACGATPEAGK